MQDRFLHQGEESFRNRQGSRRIRVTIDLDEADYRTLKRLTDRLSVLTGDPVLSHSAVWREMLRITAESPVLHPAIAERLRIFDENDLVADGG